MLDLYCLSSGVPEPFQPNTTILAYQIKMLTPLVQSYLVDLLPFLKNKQKQKIPLHYMLFVN